MPFARLTYPLSVSGAGEREIHGFDDAPEYSDAFCLRMRLNGSSDRSNVMRRTYMSWLRDARSAAVSAVRACSHNVKVPSAESAPSLHVLRPCTAIVASDTGTLARTSRCTTSPPDGTTTGSPVNGLNPMRSARTLKLAPPAATRRNAPLSLVRALAATPFALSSSSTTAPLI